MCDLLIPLENHPEISKYISKYFIPQDKKSIILEEIKEKYGIKLTDYYNKSDITEKILNEIERINNVQ